MLHAGTLFLILTIAAEGQTPADFASPGEAAKALVEAAKGGREGFLTLFGKSAADLFPEKDTAANAERLAASASEGLEIEIDPTTDGFATVAVGNTGWEFPIPLVRRGMRWHFDVSLGRKEVAARIIGTNEIAAIEASRGYVDLQLQYASRDRDGDGILEYASKVISSPGKHDGLYDDASAPDIAREFAAAMGPAASRKPFRGYYFKILPGRGMVEGNLVGDVGLLAWPAEYGVTGIRSFIVSYDGVVYERDLGRATAKVAATMTRYAPDTNWTAVPDDDDGEEVTDDSAAP